MANVSNLKDTMVDDFYRIDVKADHHQHETYMIIWFLLIVRQCIETSELPLRGRRANKLSGMWTNMHVANAGMIPI